VNRLRGQISIGALAIVFSFVSLPHDGAVAATPCFKVYDGGGTLKYEGQQAPVDLRDSDSESWAQLRRRSEHLLWYTSERCQGSRQQAARSTAGRRADRSNNAELLLGRIPAFAGR
jgi:hypothetical protein